MEPDDPDGRKPALLSLRSALVLTMALLIALAAGGLLYAAHHSIVLAVLGGGGAFGVALKLINDMIELSAFAIPSIQMAMFCFIQRLNAVRSSQGSIRGNSTESGVLVRRPIRRPGPISRVPRPTPGPAPTLRPRGRPARGTRITGARTYWAPHHPDTRPSVPGPGPR